jgi:hypothetical protein
MILSQIHGQLLLRHSFDPPQKNPTFRKLVAPPPRKIKLFWLYCIVEEKKNYHSMERKTI